jgi:UDP-2,3-diacylglucosamine pyrophosphatase LpxH
VRIPAQQHNPHLRAVFLSDVHLGFRGCNAAEILDFLRSVESDYLYLVGDIIDFESLRQRHYWPPAHQEVLNALFAKARAGTRVIYVPGNHDAELRVLCASRLGNIEIVREYVHLTAAGRRMLVIHGDDFDTKVTCPPWLSRLGNVLYDFILALNRQCNAARRRLKLPYFSLAGHLKRLFTTATDYIASYERAVARHARERGFDGVICGHIHQARIATIEGVLYCNDGDWVESCSVLVENAEGALALWQWPMVRATMPRKVELGAAVPVR